MATQVIRRQSRSPMFIRSMTALLSPIAATALAAALATLAVLLRWRGSDLPAHFFRVGLVERDGLEVWNNHWFGGHHTLGYGVLFPLLGATLGIWTVAVASAAASALLVERLLAGAGAVQRAWLASLWFAAGTVTNVAIGRLPFALGVVLGLGALFAVQRGRHGAAFALTASTAAASPVVSAFLAIVHAARFVTTSGLERRRAAVGVVAAVAPVLIVSALYPQGGTFPFRWGALVWTLAVCAVVWLLVPAEHRLVRVTAAVYAVASIAAFAIPTPVGANLTRFGMYAAAPVLLALVPGRRVILALVLPLLWFWQWSPAFDAIVRAGDDSSTEEAYHRPLIEFLTARESLPTRIEVVPTSRHWEAAYVATEIPIARGWERQLDKRFNPLFYEPDLDADAYRGWLLRTGVEYVALSDAPLDVSGRAEAELLEAGQPFLRPVWTSAHWRVWAVVDASGLLDGPAAVVEMGTDNLVLHVTEPGDLLVRVRASAFWASEPPTCITPTADGWIVLHDVVPGPLEVFLDEGEAVTADDPCDAP
jgi:hypothetical protein